MDNRLALRRKHYLLEPRFQLRFTLLLLGAGMILSSAGGLTAYLTFKPLYEQLVQSYYHQSPELAERLEQQLQSLKTTWMALILAFTIVCSLIGIVLTHRLVGPLHQLRRAMERVAEGDLQQNVQFREGDDFTDLAQTFNRMMESIRHSNERMR